jgi:hypothetical protein
VCFQDFSQRALGADLGRKHNQGFTSAEAVAVLNGRLQANDCSQVGEGARPSLKGQLCTRLDDLTAQGQ